MMVPGSIEAERMFSTTTFIKRKPAEPADHPPQPVRTYILASFPYAEAIMAWRATATTRGCYGGKK